MYSFLSSDVWNTIGNQYYMLKLTVISPVSTQGWWIWVVGYFRILSKMGSVTGSLCLQKFLHLSRSIASSQITGSGSLVELTSQLATRTFHLTDCYCFGFLNWQGCESIQKKRSAEWRSKILQLLLRDRSKTFRVIYFLVVNKETISM